MSKLCIVSVTVALAIALTACGRDSSDSADASPSIDAPASIIDASTAADAASSIDAAVGIDGGVGIDAGDPADAGPTLDADTTPAVFMINEFVLDQAGTDSGEFVELKGTANTDYSAYTVLQIDGDFSTNPSVDQGAILTIHAVGTTDANGYFLIDPPSNSFQNGTQTLLLVREFTGAVNDDIDADDNGTIDTTPWAELVDAVAVFDNRPSVDNMDHTYAGGAVVTKVFGVGNEPVEFGGGSRIPDGTDTNGSSDWTSNTPAIDNAGIVSGEALNTPGAANAEQPQTVFDRLCCSLPTRSPRRSPRMSRRGRRRR